MTGEGQGGGYDGSKPSKPPEKLNKQEFLDTFGLPPQETIDDHVRETTLPELITSQEQSLVEGDVDAGVRFQTEVVAAPIIGVTVEPEVVILNGDSENNESSTQINELARIVDSSLKEILDDVLAARELFSDLDQQGDRVGYGAALTGAIMALSKVKGVPMEQLKRAKSFFNQEFTRVSENDTGETLSEGKKLTESQKNELKRLQNEARGRGSREHPEDVDGMTKRAREILNFLEGTDYHSNEITISGETTKILTRIIAEANNRPELAELNREIMARLCLHDTAVFMGQATGSFSDKGYSVGRAIGDISSNSRFLQRDHLKLLFEEGVAGLPFAQAWDLLELANFNYFKLKESEMVEKGIKRDEFKDGGVLEETLRMFEDDLAKATTEKEKAKISGIILGIKSRIDNKKPANEFDNFYDPKFGNYEYEQKDAVKKAVGEYIVRRLMEESGVGRIEAEKALQLAQKFIVASGEDSVFNYAYAKGDNFSELIQFGRFREDENKPLKQKNGGPNIHRGYIKSINAGWLRNFCGINDPDLMVTSKTIVDHLDVLEGKLTWGGYYGSFLFPKFLPAYQALMNSKPLKPEEAIDINFIKQNVDVFNKSDPENKKHLKAYWIAGLLQTTLDQHMSPWTSYDIKRFKDLVTNQPLSLPDEKVPSVLLSKEEWKWIEKELGLKWLIFLKSLGNFFRKIGSHRR